jgi:hypothetical protein
MSKRRARGLRDLDAERLRHHRRELGATREDLAAYMRAAGHKWSELTVRDVENTSHELTREEWLRLLDAFGGAEGFYGDVWLELSPGGRERPGRLAEIVAGIRPTAGEMDPETLARHRERYDAKVERAEAERKAAAALGVDVATIRATARQLWRRNLTRQREVDLKRELERRGGDSDARSRQAIRGHITRRLLKELRAHLEGKEKP